MSKYKTCRDLKFGVKHFIHSENELFVSVPWLKEAIKNRITALCDNSEEDELCKELNWMLSLLEQKQ